MTTENERFHVKVILDPEDHKKLLSIQTHYNLKTKTDAVRLAIGDSFKIVQARKTILEDIALTSLDTPPD